MNISEPQHKLLKSMSEKVLTHVNYVALELFPIGHFTGEWAARIRKWDESVELAQKELEQLESIGLVAQDSYLGKPWYVLTTAGQEAPSPRQPVSTGLPPARPLPAWWATPWPDETESGLK